MLQRRAKFESRPENCGQWERAFPSPGGAAAAQHDECMAAARDAYESHHSCRLRAHLNSLAARHDQAVSLCDYMSSVCTPVRQVGSLAA